MYGRNLALLYQAPSYTSDKATEELSNEELKQLIQDVESMLDDSVRDAFSTNILRHVGDQANYELKAQALQSLKLVADKLHDTDTEDSEKTIIALKLQERAENCTPGFHNGINEIVEGFYMADNLQDLLFRVRQDIVSRLATTLTEDTHANNHIFAMAENLKYGVRAINRQDIYINTNRLDEHIIEEKLKEAFKKNLGLFGMLQGVEDQLKGQLMSLGYEGVQSEGYKHGTTDKLFDYFMRLFKDTDTVNNYTIAKTDLESTRKKAEEARTEAELSIEALLEKHKIPLESHKSAKIKALLGDKSVLNLPFIKTFLETLPLNLLNSDDLKKIRNTLTERSEVTDANTEYSERNQALHQKFFIGENGIVTDINWPEIKQLIWHQVRDQQYFKFRKANEELTGAEKLMEAITDPNTQSLDDLKDYFRDLINNIDDFIFVKQYLPPEQQRVLHESFDDTVPNIIQNAEDLGMIFKYSDLENQKRLFTATQKLHETLIQDPDSLLSFVQHLEPEICSQLFTDISVKLSTLINNKHDFLHVFDKISPEAQPQFIDFMKNKIPDIIQSLDDVKDVLKHQKQQGQDLFLAAIKEHIPNIIKNTEDVRQAFDYYSPEFQIDFLQTKKQKLLEMIIDERTFGDALSAFSPENQPQFIEFMKELLPHIMQSLDNVKDVLKHQNQQVQDLFLDAIKEHIPNIINNTEDFKQACRYYSPEFQIDFLQTKKQKLLKMITDSRTFGDALSAFSPENQPQFIEFIKNKIPDIIQSLDDVKDVLKHQNQQGQDLFLDAIKEHIPNIINNTEDFKQACRYYSPEFQIDFLQTKKQKLLEMITFTGGSRFGDALSAFSPENQPQFIEFIKYKIPDIIQSLDDVKDVLKHQNQQGQDLFLDAIKEHIANIINNTEDLKQACRYYSPEFQIDFLQTKKQKLLEMITFTGGSRFGDALSAFSPENQPQFIELLKNNIPNISEDLTQLAYADAFENSIAALSPENQPQFIEFMKELLPHIIVIDRNEFINERMRSRTDLIHDMILSFHSEKNRTFFIEVISKLLPIIIQNTKDLQDVLDYLSTETQDQIVEAASTNEENRQKFYTMKDELNQMKDDDSGCYIMDDDDIFLPPF